MQAQSRGPVRSSRSASSRRVVLRVVAALCVAAALLAGSTGRADDHLRHPSLAGAPNFRDIGGYATSDGRHVRWGLVYRTGQLSKLTAGDYQFLDRLGIEAVCDFRVAAEKDMAPTRWVGDRVPEFVALDNPPTPGAADLLSKGATPADLRTYMLDTYATLVRAYAPSYATTLRAIVRATGPVVLHCSSGKDRTGIFTALLLTFLGVPRATVVEDYLLSNEFVRTDAAVAAMAGQLRTSTENAGVLLGVDEAYLSRAFETIDREFGSLDRYRREMLGLSDADLVSLKARLLE